MGTRIRATRGMVLFFYGVALGSFLVWFLVWFLAAAVFSVLRVSALVR